MSLNSVRAERTELRAEREQKVESIMLPVIKGPSVTRLLVGLLQIKNNSLTFRGFFVVEI